MSDSATPGWYHAQGDPPGTERFWDGAAWTEGPRPVGGGTPDSGFGNETPSADFSSTMPDTSMPDTSMPDTGGFSTETPSADFSSTMPDTSMPDTSMPDTSMPDTGGFSTETPSVDMPSTDMPSTTMPSMEMPTTDFGSSMPDTGGFGSPAPGTPGGFGAPTPAAGNAPQDGFSTPAPTSGFPGAPVAAVAGGAFYAEQSQAQTALILAIVGALLCGPLAIVGAVMGNTERKAIDEGRRDPANRGKAMAALIIGGIVTALFVLVILFVVLAIALG